MEFDLLINTIILNKHISKEPRQNIGSVDFLVLVNYGMTNHSNFGDINPLTADHRVCQKEQLQAITHKNGGLFSCHNFDIN